MSNQPPCVAWADKLALRHEDLSPADRVALDAHVQGCPACEATQTDYRFLDARLRALPPPTMQPLPRLSAALAKREEREELHANRVEEPPPRKPATHRSDLPRPAAQRFPVWRVKKLLPAAFVALLILSLLALFSSRLINTRGGYSLGSTLYTYQGHTNFVDAVAWSPDGRYIASGSWDNTVQVWDVRAGTRLVLYTGHSDVVSSLAWSPDGRYIASGSWDHTVQVWNAQTGALVYKTRFDDFVDSVAWSPDGHSIAVGLEQETLDVLDARTGSQRFSLIADYSVINTVAWSPDSRYIAAGYRDGTVQIWNATTGAPLSAYKIDSNEVRSLAWSPDGRYIATGSWDHTVRVWNSKTGVPLVIYRGHTGNVDAVAWSPDGHLIASASWDNTVQVWQAIPG